MRTVVLVPRRADGGRRDQLWQWVAARWHGEHSDWTIYEGNHDEGPFNRSAAVNNAAAAAGEWDVAIVADADSFVGCEQARESVALAHSSNAITFAFDVYAYLSRRMSDLVIAGDVGNWERDGGVEFTMQNTCSSMLAVSRTLWDTVGGFDEDFVGWGMEDVAFSLACQALGNGTRRVKGIVWHLHHTPSLEDRDGPLYRANLARVCRYLECESDADKMRALLAELGVHQ